jgi:hypothetical protein
MRKAEEGEEGALDGWIMRVDEEKYQKIVWEELNRLDPEAQKKLRLA